MSEAGAGCTEGEQWVLGALAKLSDIKARRIERPDAHSLTPRVRAVH